MAYIINKYNNTVVATVADGTVDNTTDLKFIGKNYAGYGEIQNENFLFLLENFAGDSAPPRPIPGQLWFQTTTKKLKFYDAEKANGGKWRTTGGAEVSDGIEPPGLTAGDFWYDSTNEQLYASNGDDTFTLIGPQGVSGAGTTQVRSRSVKDSSGASHPIIEALVDNATVFIVSQDSEFTLGSINEIEGFIKVQKGITLAYTTNDSQFGQTTTDHRFHGTATNSDRLGGRVPSDYVLAGSAIFNSLVRFSDAGYTVGDTNVLKVSISGGTTPVIHNQQSSLIEFKTISGTPMILSGVNILPGSDNATDLGASGTRFKAVHALSFNGTATQAGSLAVGTEYKTASVSSSTGTIVARTSVDETIGGTNITAGAVKGTFFVGTATAANYADLAEKYLADAEYEVGTVLMVGGEKEVTACQVGFRAVGPVSENPAYLMNLELEGGTPIALKGRVPVKVTGQVIKGQRLVAGPNGTAQAAMGNTADVFAVALASSDDVNVKLVECLIL